MTIENLRKMFPNLDRAIEVSNFITSKGELSPNRLCNIIAKSENTKLSSWVMDILYQHDFNVEKFQRSITIHIKKPKFETIPFQDPDIDPASTSFMEKAYNHLTPSDMIFAQELAIRIANLDSRDHTESADYAEAISYVLPQGEDLPF